MPHIHPLLRHAFVVPVLLIGVGLHAAPQNSGPPAPVARHVYRGKPFPFGTPVQHN